MSKNILQSPAPNLQGIASPEFIKTEFDAAIYLKGYTTIIEKALRCPCHEHHPLIDCENCFGTGYFYINPIRTNSLITGINQNNQYKTWSEELLGTIAITVRDIDKPIFGYFDRITLKNEYSYFSENLIVRRNESNIFVFTTYKPIELISLHIFISSAQKLVKLSNFTINPNNPYCIILDESELEDSTSGVVSVYYKHEPQYHILDFPHEVRASWVKNKSTGSLEKIQLPVQAIARRSHLIDIRPNFDGSGVIENDNI